MIRSMTGFATKSLVFTLEDGSKAQVAISLKSLNSRFFEVTCKLPYPLSNLETEITKLLKKHLYRGHIYFTINTNTPNAFKSVVEPALSIIREYLKAIDVIKKECGVQESPSLNTILQLPNVFNLAEKNLDSASTELILQTTKQLVDEVIKAQEIEGKTLLDDIMQRITIMQKEIDEIEHNSADLMEAQKAKLHQALQEMTTDEQKSNDLHKNTLYSLLDKMDIHEEIVRFKSHLKSLSAHLNSAEVEKGKRLDFTLQELAREINTIAAKCSDAAIGSLAINVKVELEKAREQTQNIV
jgi:uncharacterized protein (TIGR00255 family)